MIPHERSLVKRLADKPFALIGVNTDDRRSYDSGVEQHKVTWRSFMDGSTSGDIVTQWGIEGYPTIYVLDAKGVIRYRDVVDEKMDAAVETLLAEVEG